ncbi:MAG: restriction endonuclease subunit S [Deltaproteobacteria bacterium]|nr:restriction endonuclease subunit S [Candidatus Anaeroferrophillacea bacterium]
MREWKEMALEEIAFINPSESLPKGTMAKKVAMTDIQPFTKKVTTFSIEPYNGGMKFRNGDTLVARITPCLENGKTAYVDILDDGEVGFGSTEYIVIREQPEISDKHFLYYFSIFSEFRDVAIQSMTGSSGRQRVQTEVVTNHRFLLPSPPEQCAIASILSSLDDKIDLLHRQNKTLEAMAETLFRQWFVEEAQENWEEGVLSDEFDFTMGQSPPGNTFNEEGIGMPMFQGNADFGFRFPAQRVYTTEPTRFAKANDTLISVRAPVGAQNMADTECCIGRGVAAFRYKHKSSYYTYTYFKLRSLMREITMFNDEGTVFGSISKTDFQKIATMIPPVSLIKKFEETASPINDKVIANCVQIKSLETLRDTLLPKLMSGEVRVDYERQDH